MSVSVIPLNLLPMGKWGEVKAILADGSCRRRMLDLGLINGTRVEAVLKSPAGDPVAYSIRGALIALRSDEAKNILVEKLEVQ